MTEIEQELAKLRDQLEKAEAENSLIKSALDEANGESAKRKTKLQKLQEELEAKDQEITKVKGERDQELEATKGKLREVNHKQVFAKVAKELGANEGALDDLYVLSGYKPDGDEVNEDIVKGLVSSTLEAKPYFKAQEAAKPVVLHQGQGASRGSVTTPPTNVFRESELKNVLLGPRKEQFVQASKEKTLTVVPD